MIYFSLLVVVLADKDGAFLLRLVPVGFLGVVASVSLEYSSVETKRSIMGFMLGSFVLIYFHFES